MADLIDRQALIERHCEGCTADVREVCKNDPICASLMWVVEEPAVDAVEVVRCKDCKHWLKDFAGCTDNVGRCEWANYMVGAAGYCVYGERREDDG